MSINQENQGMSNERLDSYIRNMFFGTNTLSSKGSQKEIVKKEIEQILGEFKSGNKTK